VRREDIPLLCRFNNDLEVELSGGGDPPMPQSLERVLAEFDAGLARGGRDGTSFVIEADGKCIGQCALFQFDHVAHTCALGITIGDKGYWGRGYGREALQLLLHYGFVMHNLHKVWLTVNSNNERALRAYRACGFVEEGRLRQQVWSNGQYLDLVYMGVLRGEWARQNAERSGRLV
jgi:RimJ/RimL family protein N-acetyltransferase